MEKTDAFGQEQDESGDYEIRIRGHLDGLWAGWFDGLALTLEESGDTLISVSLPDQAALFGLLGRIRDAGMALVSVNRVTRGGADRGDEEP
jgi:hypothetical protein